MTGGQDRVSLVTQTSTALCGSCANENSLEFLVLPTTLLFIFIFFQSVTLPTLKKNFIPRKSQTPGSTRDIFPLFPPPVPT